MSPLDSEHTDEAIPLEFNGLGATLLEVNGLTISLNAETDLFHDVGFRLHEGDVLILEGKSGSGKSTLLKSLAHLNLYGGEILFRGKPPAHYGIPMYRTYVLYVPQRPSLLPGTPRDFLQRIAEFSAYKARTKRKHNAFTNPSTSPVDLNDRAMQIAREWGIEDSLWDRPWPTLSGGEAQRISLATAVGLNCSEVLLLDEPTSALDSESSWLVEKHLTGMLGKENVSTKALVWITHSPEQGRRVGNRFLTLANGTMQEEDLAGNSV